MRIAVPRRVSGSRTATRTAVTRTVLAAAAAAGLATLGAAAPPARPHRPARGGLAAADGLGRH